MSKKLTRVVVFWDNSVDLRNLTPGRVDVGWAFKVEHGEHQESGGIEGLDKHASGTDLQEAVVSLCHENDVVITCDDVFADPLTDGGYAEWVAPCTDDEAVADDAAGTIFDQTI